MKRLTVFLLMVVLSIKGVGQDSSQLKRINEVSARIMMQHNDPARLQMYALYSTYLTGNNIYPNPDAIDLIEAYNKNVSYTEIKNNTKVFKPLLLDTMNAESRKQVILLQNVIVTSTPERMKESSAIFNQKQEQVNALPYESVPANFKQSLLNFRNVILPHINDNAANIPTLQLDFFLASLNDINHLMDKITNSADNTETMKAVKELMDDFVAYVAKPVKAIKYTPSHLNGGNMYHPNTLLRIAAEIFSPADDADLPNADVYVYTRDSLGKWDNKPKKDAFNVYYGANGLKYSLMPGCDTLSFFKYHPSVPASTLPITLAKGNYCFVLESVSTHKLYLRPDINLRDNKVVDEQKLIKLCFKADD
jgi:hypothetical protein